MYLPFSCSFSAALGRATVPGSWCFSGAPGRVTVPGSWGFSAAPGRVTAPGSRCFLWLCFGVFLLGEAAASVRTYGGILPPAQLEILEPLIRAL